MVIVPRARAFFHLQPCLGTKWSDAVVGHFNRNGRGELESVAVLLSPYAPQVQKHTNESKVKKSEVKSYPKCETHKYPDMGVPVQQHEDESGSAQERHRKAFPHPSATRALEQSRPATPPRRSLEPRPCNPSAF